MKRLLFVLGISTVLILCLSVVALANDTTQTQARDQIQSKIQLQDCVQTDIAVADRDQARLQLRDRLQLIDQDKISDQADGTGEVFTDTAQHWAREQICLAATLGLANGYPNGIINPDGDISGMEGIIMVSRMMNGIIGEDDFAVTPADIDMDLVPLWAKERIQEVSALRIASQSQLYGQAQLNRLQFAIMLAKALNLEPIELDEDTVAFIDQDTIPSENLGYVYALRMLGVIEGNQGAFNAEQLVTRAEAAAMLIRVWAILE